MQREWTECFQTFEEDHSGAKRPIVSQAMQPAWQLNRLSGLPTIHKLHPWERQSMWASVYMYLWEGWVCVDMLVRERTEAGTQRGPSGGKTGIRASLRSSDFVGEGSAILHVPPNKFRKGSEWASWEREELGWVLVDTWMDKDSCHLHESVTQL